MNYSFLLSFIISVVMALIAMAFYTLMERKFLGYFQLRKGPNKVMLLGLPQPFADAIKLLTKEQSAPLPSNSKLFYIAPTMGLMLATLLWVIFPHNNPSLFLPFSILYFLCVSSLNVYITFMSGWCSNSKYALLGALRGVAQTISYEVSMTLILLCTLLIMMTMDMHIMTSHMYSWVMIMASPIFVMWYITNLAETNRSPFDLAEGESELVSGFNTEYSSGLFAMIFMAEYANILMMSLLTVVFFTGHTQYMNNSFMIFKTMIVASIYLWVRATLPRMRYDMLMSLTWKAFLPISLANLMLITSLLSNM